MDSYAVYVIAASAISLIALLWLCAYALWQYRLAQKKVELRKK